MILRLLNIQGVVGLFVSACLGVLLFLQKTETRMWRERSGRLDQLYRGEQAASAATVANYRLAAEQARAADQARAERVAAEQRTISQRTNDDFKARIAAARALGEQLRLEAAGATADSRDRGAASVSGIPAAAGRPHEAANQDELSPSDRLIATEQAIQLDELIKWVRAQAKIDPNGGAAH